MRVYLSARYACMDDLKVWRADLIAVGFECSSRWLDGGTFVASAESAEIDEADVASSDVVVGRMELPEKHSPYEYASRGGRHYEIGFARGLGIPCIMIGSEPENVFHYPRQGMIVVSDWRSCLDRLKVIRAVVADDARGSIATAAAMVLARLVGRHTR